MYYCTSKCSGNINKTIRGFVILVLNLLKLITLHGMVVSLNVEIMAIS